MVSNESGMLRTMEFQDVVRRRKMVRDYAEEPVDPAIIERALHNAVRAPNAGLQPGLGLPRPRPAGRRTPLLGADDRSRGPRRAGRVAHRHDARPGHRHPVLEQGRLPQALRPGRQGLDRRGRGPLAGPVLAHRHRHGRAADPADRHRRGPRRVLLRRPAGARERGPRARSASPTPSTRSARSPSATAPRPTGCPARRASGRAGRRRTSSTTDAGPSEPGAGTASVHRPYAARSTRPAVAGVSDARHLARDAAPVGQ